MKPWVADTGPLVALIVADDHQHEWAVAQSKAAPPAVITCEAVISEALFLLKRDGHESDDLFALIEAGFLRCTFEFQTEHRQVRELMRRCADRPMSLADACLVRMAELHSDSVIWTLDRDFQVYRRNKSQTLSLVTPW